jgi:hypothetical protein
MIEIMEMIMQMIMQMHYNTYLLILYYNYNILAG